MKFETKFDLGQTVHVFDRAHRELFDLCPTCAGKGTVTVVGADGLEVDTICPRRWTVSANDIACKNGRIRSVWHNLWQYVGTAKIGRVEITAYDPLIAPRYAEKLYEERYMIDTTGVGGGTVYSFDPKADSWSHTWLFESEAEGQAWAEAENAPMRAEAEEKRARMREAGPA